MEIKITITVGDNEPIEVKVDVPLEDETECKERTDVSQYAIWFDDTCGGWTKDPEMNKMFLLQQQNYANVRLQTVGYLFLNEVYDMLGMPRTKAGQNVGWVYNLKNPIGDNYVDFGLYEEESRKFVNGFENAVLLDFNVDGDILKYL